MLARRFLEDGILSQENAFSNNNCDIKTKCLSSIVKNKTFQELPRLLRMELVAIDGATLICASGKILSIGAILRLNNSSTTTTSGGRTLAAMSLATYGLGIKISNDGYIKVFSKNATNPPLVEIS